MSCGGLTSSRSAPSARAAPFSWLASMRRCSGNLTMPISSLERASIKGVDPPSSSKSRRIPSSARRSATIASRVVQPSLHFCSSPSCGAMAQ
ncbi:hypothetical protein SERLADRAFT_478569 [Serpula lacrymans var. lacrymans S7.9]|uniref:Uncharacterized protein n=1 Tax=Serpula lacrymans var. lacrymans (strain S7.9) TaxID=578457 RepID=F8P9Z1_SERL9|nr:uncharacterized protein SERLADRAFT_478569 [Serpula lacrymans var. lacrymans S7.9]EGO19989.1 hypothetical protein SERLADRAFT_478569 [Serpula lacrymans var. lacrymans S7.9]